MTGAEACVRSCDTRPDSGFYLPVAAERIVAGRRCGQSGRCEPTVKDRAMEEQVLVRLELSEESSKW